MVEETGQTANRAQNKMRWANFFHYRLSYLSHYSLVRHLDITTVWLTEQSINQSINHKKVARQSIKNYTSSEDSDQPAFPDIQGLQAFPDKLQELQRLCGCAG